MFRRQDTARASCDDASFIRDVRFVWIACALWGALGCAGTGRRGTDGRVQGEPVATAPTATDVEYFRDNALMVPVAGVAPDRVRDTFNEARDNGGRIHRATDILASRGTPVVAVSSGTVLRMSQNTRGGITLYMLDTRKRFLFYYAHLDRYSDYVSPNARVAQGTILGYVGSSGNADPGAPHLHFQAMRWDPERRDYWNGAPVDVRPFFQLIGQEREN